MDELTAVAKKALELCIGGRTTEFPQVAYVTKRNDKMAQFNISPRRVKSICND